MKALTMSVASMALAALTALGQAGAIGNKTELRRSLASARTAADHARIAAYLNPHSPGELLVTTTAEIAVAFGTTPDAEAAR